MTNFESKIAINVVKSVKSTYIFQLLSYISQESYYHVMRGNTKETKVTYNKTSCVIAKLNMSLN